MSGQPPTAQPMQPQDPHGAPPPEKTTGENNGLVMGLGITGLVIGILALMLSFVPCVGALAIWPGAIAVIFSGIATFIGYSSKAKSSGLAVAALVISLLAVAGGVYQRSRVVKVIDEGGKQFEKGMKELNKELNKAVKEAQKKNNNK